MGWPRAIISTAMFPVLFAGCLLLAWAAIVLGAPPALVMLAGIPTATACFIAERLLPHAPFWRQGQRDVPTDLAHIVFSQLGGSSLAVVIVEAIPIDLAVWPSRWPIVAQLALALVATELVQYAWHRACHANSLLWRIHAAHHSAPRLTWLTSARFHPIEVVVEYVLVYTPLVVLGAPFAVVAMFSVATMVCSLLQHSNVELRLGPLDWVFAGAELHRRHHAADPASQRVNYGTILIVWDVVFGTRSLPPEPQDPRDVGLAGFPQTYVGQLLAPVRWKP